MPARLSFLFGEQGVTFEEGFSRSLSCRAGC
jgi:hypothetical protein